MRAGQAGRRGRCAAAAGPQFLATKRLLPSSTASLHLCTHRTLSPVRPSRLYSILWSFGWPECGARGKGGSLLSQNGIRVDQYLSVIGGRQSGCRQGGGKDTMLSCTSAVLQPSKRSWTGGLWCSNARRILLSCVTFPAVTSRLCRTQFCVGACYSRLCRAARAWLALSGLGPRLGADRCPIRRCARLPTVPSSAAGPGGPPAAPTPPRSRQ